MRAKCVCADGSEQIRTSCVAGMKRFFDRSDETSNKFSALRAITSGSPIL